MLRDEKAKYVNLSKKNDNYFELCKNTTYYFKLGVKKEIAPLKFTFEMSSDLKF